MNGQRVDSALFHAAVGTASAAVVIYVDASDNADTGHVEVSFSVNAGQVQISDAAYARTLRDLADELDPQGAR